MNNYKIVRFYQRDGDDGFPGAREIVKRNLTLEQAQAHCNDPETSSSTAKSARALRRTEAEGPWFDGFTEQ